MIYNFELEKQLLAGLLKEPESLAEISNFISNSDFYSKQSSLHSAIFRIIKILGGVRKILLVFKFLPTFIRNFFYDLIASNRFVFRKPLEYCPVPRADVASRFLD